MTDEQVLGLSLARLRQLGLFSGLTTDVERFLPALCDPAHLSFRPRSQCETDPTWLQLIPYVVLTHDGRVFHYTRGAKGGEKRLHALKSVGIGGHINPIDADGGDPYRAGLRRELAEEIATGPVASERVLGLIYDPSTPVGQVHLGIVHVYDLQDHHVQLLEPGLLEPGYATVAELAANRQHFETWSQFVLDELAAPR